MKNLGYFIGFIFTIFALILLYLLLSKVYLILAAVYVGAKTLEPKIYVPLFVTAFTASVGLYAALYTQNRIRKREVDAAHRERKIAIYLDFLETLTAMMISNKPEFAHRKLSDNDAANKLIDIRTKAVLWGSPGVLKSLGTMGHQGGAADPVAMFNLVETIQREMRKDIGLSNRGLPKDFFTKIFLTDPDELDKMKKLG